MKIDHIGYAVKKLEYAIEEFQRLGFSRGGVFNDSDRNIRICFMENNGYVIELVAPLGKNSPVDNYLKKNGSIPYHFCYTTKKLAEEISKLEKEGFRVVIPPRKSIAFQENYVVFMFGQNTGLFEIVEK